MHGSALLQFQIGLTIGLYHKSRLTKEKGKPIESCYACKSFELAQRYASWANCKLVYLRITELLTTSKVAGCCHPFIWRQVRSLYLQDTCLKSTLGTPSDSQVGILRKCYILQCKFVVKRNLIIRQPLGQYETLKVSQVRGQQGIQINEKADLLARSDRATSLQGRNLHVGLLITIKEALEGLSGAYQLIKRRISTSEHK